MGVIFNFVDGPKEINVGDTFITSNYNRKMTYERTVDAIGKKYITSGKEKFSIETGVQKTEYTASVCYSSKEAYDRLCLENRVIDSVRAKMRNVQRITYKQALAIEAILESDHEPCVCDDDENYTGVCKHCNGMRK